MFFKQALSSTVDSSKSNTANEDDSDVSDGWETDEEQDKDFKADKDLDAVLQQQYPCDDLKMILVVR
eukprot:CAMPEP_0176377798 /NCGR_PEP_ID=MMETSP0126-20121128/29151_1 /TAXON_ID=141414 ORGANISM="Strombidinopsis acuminatum, Strain SPMC142" /NCGR_SAMPLE_ID=MMETSP0126 /ASSEMBLY_ACC=CAM_ASM_000229 /LENGTH=66 /DNA_ID=CAMNT_0017739801 /DNA_START=71 /DNA_END=271 /DNA_ORIENTATION=-